MTIEHAPVPSKDVEVTVPSTAQVLEKKKILSLTERLGLLSAADKAGFNLAKVRPVPRPYTLTSRTW